MRGVGGATFDFGDEMLPEDLMSFLAGTLLHLADDLAGFTETFHHLLALLAPPDGIIALFEKVIKFLRPVHLLEQFPLHFIFRVPERLLVGNWKLHHRHGTYWTRVNMIALGTISIMVLRTMLK